MIIAITEQAGRVSAMGHSVGLDQGGAAELKRRCLETLCRLKDPPDRIWFRLPGDTQAEAPPSCEPVAALQERRQPATPPRPVASQGRKRR